MDWLLFSIFLVVCFACLAHGLFRRGGIYEYPFLAGATFLGFVGPQLPGILDDRFLPDGSVPRMLIVTILCAAMCGLGWLAGRRPFQRSFRWHLSERHLLWIAGGLSAFGAFFFFKISRLPEEIRTTTMPSGILTIYLFFARMMIYGFVIAVLCCASRISLPALAIIAVDSIFLFDRILATGKRGELTEFALAFLLAAFFQRRIVVPRVLFLSAALLAGVALTSVEVYREHSRGSNGVDWSSVSQIDVLGNFGALLDKGGPEMRNAALRIHFIHENQAFDFGLTHWNALVYTFVPAQLVGAKVKEELYVPLPEQIDRFYTPDLGTTETAMADTFASFGYLGALKLFLIAYLLSRLYHTALEGFALPQIIYILSITPAMTSITHYTQWVFSAWFQMAVILIPLLFLARVRVPRTVEAMPGSERGYAA
ncbi:hypothetical protein [Microvirga pakistanensis]|uniref:hypothetical protein n=1 Tax=Microvirga pakistanensis TaxID=1682650 RepID=UPI00106C448D|nr:hypothetical protein [Microvirga pakistanensis]